MPLEVGSRLGHYDVTALIGEGGMGEVYQRRDTFDPKRTIPVLTQPRLPRTGIRREVYPICSVR